MTKRQSPDDPSRDEKARTAMGWIEKLALANRELEFLLPNLRELCDQADQARGCALEAELHLRAVLVTSQQGHAADEDQSHHGLAEEQVRRVTDLMRAADLLRNKIHESVGGVAVKLEEDMTKVEEHERK